jgi:Domain of unknown function (DUF222)
MFERDVSELGMAELLGSAAEWRALRDHAEARLLEHAQHVADLNNPDTLSAFADDEHGDGRRSGRERAIHAAGAGCPAFAEFAAAEFGAVLKISAGTAQCFIGEALALRHRLPRIWAAVLAGNATPWKARVVARACHHLSEDAAAVVDRRIAGIVDSVTPRRLKKIVDAAVKEADQQAAQTAAEQKARERGVYVAPTDDHGTRSVYILAATGDVLRFDATISDLAQALAELGDTEPLRLRRAKALGILADP